MKKFIILMLFSTAVFAQTTTNVKNGVFTQYSDVKTEHLLDSFFKNTQWKEKSNDKVVFTGDIKKSYYNILLNDVESIPRAEYAKYYQKYQPVAKKMKYTGEDSLEGILSFLATNFYIPDTKVSMLFQYNAEKQTVDISEFECIGCFSKEDLVDLMYANFTYTPVQSHHKPETKPIYSDRLNDTKTVIGQFKKYEIHNSIPYAVFDTGKVMKFRLTQDAANKIKVMKSGQLINIKYEEYIRTHLNGKEEKLYLITETLK